MFNNSVMIAHYPPAVLRAALASSQPGHLPASELHVTLAYLGDEGYLDPDAVNALPATLKNFNDFATTATISGVGRFYGVGPGGTDAVYASLDAPGLNGTRDWLMSNLRGIGLHDASSQPNYTPHITLAYLQPDEPTPNIDRALIGQSFEVNTLSLVTAGERRDFIIDDDPMIPVMMSEPIVDSDGELTGPLFIHADKRATKKRIAYAAVLVPGEPDSDGDIITAEKVEEVAHTWMALYRNVDLQHTLVNTDAVPVESYILEHDKPVKSLTGEDMLLPVGTWILATKINDEAVWNKIEKGEFGGYSIMGVPNVALKSADPEMPRSAYKRTTLADIGPNWVAPFVSLVDRPAVPKAKFYVLKNERATIAETDTTLGTEPITDQGDDVALTKEELAEVVATAVASALKAVPNDMRHQNPDARPIEETSTASNIPSNPVDTYNPPVETQTSDDAKQREPDTTAQELSQGATSHAGGSGTLSNPGETHQGLTVEQQGELQTGELSGSKPNGYTGEIHANKELEDAVLELREELRALKGERDAAREELEEFRSELAKRVPGTRKSLVGQETDEATEKEAPKLLIHDLYDVHGRVRRNRNKGE